MGKQKHRTKKIRQGDNVVVLAGNSKGQRGVVEVVLGDKVIVGGVQMGIKHMKRSKQASEGGRVEVERPIHISNIAPCDADGKPVRLHVRISESGDRELYYTSNGEPVLWRSMKRVTK